MTDMTIHQHLDAQLNALQKLHEDGFTVELLQEVIDHNNRMHTLLHRAERKNWGWVTIADPEQVTE